MRYPPYCARKSLCSLRISSWNASPEEAEEASPPAEAELEGVSTAALVTAEVTMAALLSPINEVGAAEAELSENEGNCSRLVSVTVALADEAESLTAAVVLPKGRGGRLPLRWHVRVPVGPAALADDEPKTEEPLADAARSCRATMAGAAMDWVAARARTEKNAASIVDFR